jgi:hypothetical protein
MVFDAGVQQGRSSWDSMNRSTLAILTRDTPYKTILSG